MTTTYGNPSINELMEYLKNKNNGMLDGSEKSNRRACHTMIQRMKKTYPGHDPVDSLKRLIDVGKNDKFHSKNLTSFAYLIYHGTKIINGYLSTRGNSAQSGGPAADDKMRAVFDAIHKQR